MVSWFLGCWLSVSCFSVLGYLVSCFFDFLVYRCSVSCFVSRFKRCLVSWFLGLLASKFFQFVCNMFCQYYQVFISCFWIDLDLISKIPQAKFDGRSFFRRASLEKWHNFWNPRFLYLWNIQNFELFPTSIFFSSSTSLLHSSNFILEKKKSFAAGTRTRDIGTIYQHPNKDRLMWL